jgi:hypothetical protein
MSVIKLLRGGNKEMRKVNKAVLYFLLFSLAVSIFYTIAFSKTHTVCGRILRLDTGPKGAWHVDFGFWDDGKYYEGNISYGFIKDDISLDSMKKIKCVEIKCSFISNSINDLTDKRLRSD